MNTKKTIILGLLISSVVYMSCAQVDYSKKIEQLLEANVKSAKPFSGSILVARKGEIIYRGAFGFAGFKSGKRNTVDSKYFIASITKVYTAVAILQLVEQKKIALNDKISKWLPEINGSDKITIHHLLTHSSGLRRNSHQDYDAEVIYQERLFSIKNDSLMFQPGEKGRYANMGFYALTYILEAVSEMKIEDYFKKNIFIPANLNNTGFRKTKTQKIDGLSSGTDVEADSYGVLAVSSARYFDSYSLAGTGGLYSTIDDMYAFYIALESGKLLSHNTVRMMKLEWPTKEKRTGMIYHSYGWEISDLSTDKRNFLMIDFTGKIYGYRSMIRNFESDDIQIIALCNNHNSQRSQIGASIREILLDFEYNSPKPAPEYISLSKKEMKKHVGIYDFPSEKTTVEIKIINGKLTLTSHGDKPVYMYPTDKNTFHAKVSSLKITFEPTSKKKTQKVEFNFRDEMVETLNRIK